MKYLQTDAHLGEAECSNDAIKSSEVLELKLAELAGKLAELGPDAPAADRHKIELDQAYTLLELERKGEAWASARDVMDRAVAAEDWLHAVEACDVMFQSDQPDSVKALAHGIWLGVTYPVDPELTVALVQHFIDETPDKSDGAAVAAAVARYVVDLRAEGKQRDDLQFFTAQMLGDVARRHSQVDEQEVFEFWVERLELNDPSKFLPRMAQILDVMVPDAWWFDRDALRSKIPEA